jgi:uncharacterized protein (UPF0335 family)
LDIQDLENQDQNQEWAGNKAFGENIIEKLNEVIERVDRLESKTRELGKVVISLDLKQVLSEIRKEAK